MDKKPNRKKGRMGPTKQKILMLLALGLVMTMSPSSKRNWKIIKKIPPAWKSIDRHYLHRLVKEFHQDRLVSYAELPNGEIEIKITEAGKQRALLFDIENMAIKQPLRWDKQWRLVFFDIPEKQRGKRGDFRDKLREMGFIELQHSAWVYPYPCKKEIEFLMEFFEIRKYVRFAEVINLTNEAELKLKFDLS